MYLKETWVFYKGEPRYVLSHDYDEALVIDSNDNESLVSYQDLEVIDVPTFNIGEKVICVDDTTSLTGQIVTITYNDESSFAPYQYNDDYWATPFDIVKIDY